MLMIHPNLGFALFHSYNFQCRVKVKFNPKFVFCTMAFLLFILTHFTRIVQFIYGGNISYLGDQLDLFLILGHDSWMCLISCWKYDDEILNSLLTSFFNFPSIANVLKGLI
jgi:hypothetical protein